MSAQLTVIPPQELMRQSTDIATVCKDIVLASSANIQGRNYVKVEGWMSIATAHGCVASAKDVRRVDGGFVATGEIRRMSDRQLLSTGEGFVGEDEPTWFGGTIVTAKGPKHLLKRQDYAIRAMAQTRAISRACRSAFAHVVVLMDAGLSTTPAEEVPDGGFDNQTVSQLKQSPPAQTELPKDDRAITTKTVIKSVEEKSGTKNGKDWKIYIIKGANGVEAGTFDKKIADEAILWRDAGAECDVTVKPGRKEGSFELLSVKEPDDIP